MIVASLLVSTRFGCNTGPGVQIIGPEQVPEQANTNLDGVLLRRICNQSIKFQSIRGFEPIKLEVPELIYYY